VLKPLQSVLEAKLPRKVPIKVANSPLSVQQNDWPKQFKKEDLLRQLFVTVVKGAIRVLILDQVHNKQSEVLPEQGFKFKELKIALLGHMMVPSVRVVDEVEEFEQR
tara:strand:- start:20 stop:340 length:321 start_codon:yes stop_codon:yes gene_type:complete